MSSSGTSGIDFATMRGRTWPSIRQFSVFLENRVGRLSDLLRSFGGSEVRVAAMSVSESADCAIARLVLSHPEQGREILERAGLAFAESDLVGVDLPRTRQPLLDICSALLRAEVNIHCAYPLLLLPHGRGAVVLQVDNPDLACHTLERSGFQLLTEEDLSGAGPERA